MLVLLFLLSHALFAAEPAAHYSADSVEKSADFRTLLPLNVNPITGEYCEAEVDLIVAGVEPLSFRRFYCHFSVGSPLFGHWMVNPEANVRFSFWNTKVGNFVGRGEPDGGFFRYDLSKNHYWKLGETKSFTNSGLTGATHPANTVVETRESRLTKDDPNFTFLGEIRSGDGRICRFASENKSWPMPTTDPIRQSYQVKTEPPFEARITEEILPSGNILKYEYVERGSTISTEPSRFILGSITAFNREGKVKIGELKLSRHDLKGKEFLYAPTRLQITGSDKRKVTYNLESRTIVELNNTRNHPHHFDLLLSAVDAPGKSLQHYSYHWKQKKGQGVKEKIEYYHKYATLERTTTRDGLPIAIQYDGDSRVRSLSAPVGPNGEECVIASYDYQTRKTVVTDAIGNQTIYHFDDKQRMTAIETTDSIQKSHWGEQGDLLRHELLDKRGLVLSFTAFEYDKQHNPIKEITSDHTIYRQFDDKNRLIEERNGERRTTYKYEYSLVTEECIYAGDRLISTTTKSYDDAACLIKTVIDEGLSGREISIEPKRSLPNYGLPETVIERDLQGNLIKKVVYSYTAAGKVAREKHYDADNKERYTIINGYDERERLISSSDALGQITTFTYDANNNLTSLTKAGQTKYTRYDKANRPIELIDGELLVKRSYNNAGQLISERDPSSFTTEYRYDSASRLISTLYPDGSSVNQSYDPLGNVISQTDRLGFTTKISYNQRSQPIHISYPDGSSESFTYDGLGRKQSHTDKNGATTSYTYDALDNLIETNNSESRCFRKYIGSYLIAESDPEGSVTTYTYNSQGQKISEEKAGRVIRYAYDSLGRCTHVTQGDRVYVTTFDLLNRPIAKETLGGQKVTYRYDEAGNQIATTNSRGSELTTYNRHNQPIVVRDVMGNETTYSYKNGLLISETNPKGTTTHMEYDCCNRLVKIVRTDRSGQTIQAVEKAYDANGNCTQEQHHVYENSRYLKRITHTFAYGPGNRLEMLLEAGLKKTCKNYDSQGRLQATLYPNGDRHCYEYDQRGRLARYHGPDFDYQYSYDKRDNLTTVLDCRRNAFTKRFYNEHNEITEEKLENGATLFSTYNECGQRIQLTLPDCTSIGFTYIGDALHTITRGGFRHTYERDKDGAIIAYELPGKLGKVKIKRDDLLRPVEISGPSTLFSYSYDRNGNLLTENETQYKYDDLDQMTAEGGHHYRYDSLGNRLDCEVNDLCQLATHSYDQNGNLLLKGFIYDSQGRLIESPGVTYRYDSFHRRLSKSSGGITTYYLWDGENEIGSFTSQIDELRILGEGLGAEIGAAVLLELKGEKYIPIHDHRGSIRRLLSLSGSVKRFNYNAYGEGDHHTTWTFCSKRYDKETSLVYFGRRYYAPALGRWLTPDPVGFSDGPNLYAYVHNNPHHIDLYGYADHRYNLPSWRQHNFTVPLDAICTNKSFKYDLKMHGIPNLTELPRGGSVLFNNGIRNEFQEAIGHSMHISQIGGGINVYGVYNATHGTIPDIIRAGLSFKANVAFDQVRLLHDLWRERLSIADPDVTILQFGTSEGTIQIKQGLESFPEELRKRIDVVTIAPAVYISPKLCHSVRNYRASWHRDFVPRLDIKGQLAYRNTIMTLQSHAGAPFHDHSFSSPTFEAIIEKELYNYMERLEAQ